MVRPNSGAKRIPGPNVSRLGGLRDALSNPALQSPVIQRGLGDALSAARAAKDTGPSRLGRSLDQIFGTKKDPYGDVGIAGQIGQFVKSLDPRTRAGAISLASMFVPGPKAPREISPLYHGSPVSWQGEPNLQKTSPEGLFGRGLYLTNNPRVAQSYAENTDRAYANIPLGKTKYFNTREEALKYISEKPTHRRASGSLLNYPHYLNDEEYSIRGGGYFGVQEFNKPIPVVAPHIGKYVLRPGRLLHMDEPTPPGLLDAAIKYALDRHYGRSQFKKGGDIGFFNAESEAQHIIDSMLTGGPYSGAGHPRTPGDLYSRLSQNIGYRNDPNRFFRKMGYDALEYSGGTRIGGYGDHRAFVAINPQAVRPYYDRPGVSFYSNLNKAKLNSKNLQRLQEAQRRANDPVMNAIRDAVRGYKR